MKIANLPDSKSQPPVDKHNVGILLFDGVEVLDFAGPFEVFSRTRLVPGVESRRSDATAPFRVFTVARKSEPVTATGDLQLTPRYSFQTAPPIDLLVVPGGYGTRALLSDRETLDWICTTAATARKVTSVCTGSLLLAQAGLLDGKRATNDRLDAGARHLLGKFQRAEHVVGVGKRERGLAIRLRKLGEARNS